MGAIGINHVSVSANDLGESVAFYVDVLGLEPIATPNFGFPVQWLRLGAGQLHLFERPGVEVPSHHHLAITVDDFPAVLAEVRRRGIQDDTAFGHWLYRLPDGAAQLYLRDPGGNLVEINWPRLDDFDASIVGEARPLRLPQEGAAGQATLFLG
jgi:catechol 2,3-dioxygenase-like lactoylglutathione lyase family enzyme